ncbi:MAG TPA: hypothetical protein ENK98_02555 [Epsilonproteobacteria bacterium]|nr:hypothetical protein [Campylobacterota bacterium]HHD78513.1 hypothetical protein [Campylobacterota bacterium]
MKKMIFHLPVAVDGASSGSQIRPLKMLEAFRDIGYDVDVVMGYVSDRKEQIAKIKDKIGRGVKYEFLYSESSTMPTALTQKHHFPTAPFLDFNFFNFCKSHNIKIGLFYRDIYWVFPEYHKETSFFKYQFAKLFYLYDLKEYNRYVDMLYLPSKEMHAYFPISFRQNIGALPPAVDSVECDVIASRKLRFIYVGGLSGVYDLTLFGRALLGLKDVTFNLCTREQEWEKSKHMYENMPIKVHHLAGKALCEAYEVSDIAVYFIKPDKLWSFAMGVKLFEYIAYKKPIIAVKGTAIGDFVQKYDIGWVLEYDAAILEKLFISLQKNPQEIKEKIINIEKIIPLQRWEARAKQVEEDLT